MKKGPWLLLLTAFIWGMAFVAQSTAMDHIGPWTFNCLRSVLACIALFLLLPLLHKITHTSNAVYNRKRTWIGGIMTGIFLASASMFQQIGIMTTAVGKAGFITAMYVVLVPVLGIFLGKRPPVKTWFCCGLSLLGLYFLSMNGSFSLTAGDTAVLISAFLFAGHILCVDHFRDDTDPLVLSCIQFGVEALICMTGMFLFEKPSWQDITAAGVPILYAGLMSSCAGYTMQIIGQKDTDPALASILMSLESVFAAVGGWFLLHQVLSGRELFGCALTFLAVILVQIDFPKKKAPAV
jgi:drug/metabolite transporter (DMT)-like permease